MFDRPMKLIAPVLFFFIIVASVSAFASDYEGVKVTLIKKATSAANGQKLAYAKAENPEVTVALVEIPPGGDTGWHSHPILVYAYILKAVDSTISKRARQFLRSSIRRTSAEIKERRR
jgi:hypothetical protein